MRVLMRVDAGGEHGLGHFVRMHALAASLRQRGVAVEYVSATPQRVAQLGATPCWDAASIMALVRGFDSLVIDTKAPDWANDRYALQEMQDNWLDVVRIDHPHATPDTCSLLVAPCAHWPAAHVAHLRAAFGARFLYGWEYVMLDAEVTSQAPIPYSQRQSGPIVFCAGGSDPGGGLEQMYAWTKDIALASQASLPTLVFALPKAMAGARILLDHRTTTTVFRPFQRSLLRSASLVVTAFGVTVYECLWYQTPTVGIARTRDEYDGLCRLRDGLGMHIPLDYPLTYASLTAERFIALIEAYWDRDIRQSMVQASAGLLDGHGIARGADAILALEGKAHE